MLDFDSALARSLDGWPPLDVSRSDHAGRDHRHWDGLWRRLRAWLSPEPTP